jgi:MoaA/NifB/PqqE/SkfB family radical SAM enzyme
MCSVKDTGDLSYMNSYNVLLKKMKEEKEIKDSINFTGGEPTLHPDIIKIFKKADELGYENISMGSNGIKFAEKKFTKELAKHNLKTVEISLHGLEDEHNKIVNNEKAFKKVSQAIENLQRCNVQVRIISVLMKQNIINFNNFLRYLLKKGIKNVHILDLNREGRAKNVWEEINPSFVEKKNFFYKNLILLNKFENLVLFNFPRCVLPIRLPEKSRYISEFHKKNYFSFSGGIGEKKIHPEKKKILICEKCAFSEKCFGFIEESVKIYGQNNIKKMLKIDNFEKKFFK